MEKNIFLSDSYLKSYESKLLDITDDGHLIFEKGIFYALSGGQPGDEGLISWKDKRCNIVGTIKDKESNICLLKWKIKEINPKFWHLLRKILMH